jgi:glutaredoxin-like YruB-family protein
MAKHDIKIYTTPTCQYCKMTKEYLKSRNIAYEELDVTKDEHALHDMFHKTGQSAVPVIDVDGNVVIGFNKPKLDSLLGL